MAVILRDLVPPTELRQTDSALAAQVAEQIYGQSLMSAGLLDDPRSMLTRMNALLEKLVAK